MILPLFIRKAKQRCVHGIKTILSWFGLRLIRQTHYDRVIRQRDALLDMAVDTKQKRPDTLAGIIFSFDRPLQLYATLESYFYYMRHPAPLTVLYRASDTAFLKAYQDIKRAFQDKPITFVHETNFRENVIDILKTLQAARVFFLVDDDVFVAAFDCHKFLSIDPKHYVISMRLAPYYRYSYVNAMPQRPPKGLTASAHYAKWYEWDWFDSDTALEWRYPLAVEGHIFDTAEILAMTLHSEFKAPNSYEDALMSFKSVFNGRKGLCYEQQLLVNNPCNRVQKEQENFSGNISPKDLLKQWQKGLKLDILAYKNIQTDAPHQELPLTFVTRGEK